MLMPLLITLPFSMKEINEKVKAIVDESVRFAEESPLPEAQELYTDVYAQGDYPFIRD